MCVLITFDSVNGNNVTPCIYNKTRDNSVPVIRTIPRL